MQIFAKVFKFKDFFKIEIKNRVVAGVVAVFFWPLLSFAFKLKILLYLALTIFCVHIICSILSTKGKDIRGKVGAFPGRGFVGGFCK